MKQIVLLCLIPVFSYATGPIKVVTTTSIFADMIENVGGELVEVTSIVPVGSDPHLYEAKPGDVSLCQHASIIFINGLQLEVWIEKLIKNSRTKAKIVILTEGIASIPGKSYPDPHAWMNLNNGVIYAKNIAKALVDFQPALKQIIVRNLENYVQLMKETDAYIFTKIIEIPPAKRILVTNHDAFQYFGRRYGMKLVPLMGVSTEAEPKTSDIIKIMNEISRSGIQAIFVESSINPRLLQQMASDAGISIGESLYSDSLGDKESEAGTYVGMVKTNTDRIHRALLNENNKKNLPVLSQFFSWHVQYAFLVFSLFLGTLLFAKKIMK